MSRFMIHTIRAIKLRGTRWAGHVARTGRGEVHPGLWWGKTEGKRTLGRPRRRWENNNFGRTKGFITVSEISRQWNIS